MPTPCRKKTVRRILAVAWFPMLLFAWGCGNGGPSPASDGRPVAVVSFTILEDLARQVAGERVAIRVLAPVGAEVHEWELSPRNFIDLDRAELVFINGRNLEQWVPQLKATLGSEVPVVALAEDSRHETLRIRLGDLAGDPDPHLWMDPRRAADYAEILRDHFTRLDPAGEAYFRDNATAYTERLEAVHAEIGEILAAIPEDRRLLVTSEAAFLYFADAYGFHHEGIWGSNSEEEGTPRQMARVIDLIHERQPAAIFWESTITDRYVRGISEETGIPIAGPLFVDSLGGPGSGAESYLDLMRTNARTIAESLTNGEP